MTYCIEHLICAFMRVKQQHDSNIYSQYQIKDIKYTYSHVKNIQSCQCYSLSHVFTVNTEISDVRQAKFLNTSVFLTHFQSQRFRDTFESLWAASPFCSLHARDPVERMIDRLFKGYYT